MHRLRRMVASPNSLFVFEACARLGSFTEAAKSLNVSQPAVSHSIRQLETELGVQLFHRRHRLIELTSQGRKLHLGVAGGLDQIYHSALTLETQQPTNLVTVSFSAVTAATWILPRLGAFKALHPEVNLRLSAEDREHDLNRESIDLSLWRGNGQWTDVDSWLVFEERIFPVCAPDYLAKAPPLRSVHDLPKHTLLHLQEPYRDRMGWTWWLHDMGVRLPQPRHDYYFSDQNLILEAASLGLGVALAWPLLWKSNLVRPIEAEHRTGLGFYLVAAHQSQLSASALKFRDWLISQIPNQDSNVPAMGA